MKSKVSAKGMIDLKEALGNDIRDQKFNRFLFLTYSLQENLLDLFPKGGKALVYCNQRVSDKPRIESDAVKTEHFKNHAKIYCMWGSKSIKCWLGSFNLTEGGLLSNIEWAASFEGELLHSMEIEDVISGKIQCNVSDNQVVNQIIDFISHAVNREPPVISDRFFQTSMRGPILLHNLATNTLHKCIIKLAERAKKNLIITYITPFINKSGVENFSKLFQHKFHLNELYFRVLTNIPDPNYSSGTFLNNEAISDLKMKFKDFKMLKRKRGKEGTFLKDGTEIGPNFLHLKLIHISFLNEEGELENHSIFTSANLTEEAWGKTPSGNVEIGLWMRDRSNNEIVHSFIENFEFCFSDPDQQELKMIDDVFNQIESKRKLEEFWIEDLVRERLFLKKNELRLDWSDSLPEIRDLQCTFDFRNIVTGEKLHESVVFKTEDHSFICNFKTLSERKNLVLEYTKLTFDTDFESPGNRIKKHFIADFLLSENSKKYLIIPEDLRSDWNQLIVNDKKYPRAYGQKIELPTINEIRSISFIKKRNKFERTSVYIEIHDQPHLSNDFFENSTISVIELGSLGEFFEVSFKTDSHVDPPFDTIKFLSKDQRCFDPVAVSRSDGKSNYYFQTRELSGSELTAIAISPYDRYFHKKEIKLHFPVVQMISEVSDFWKDLFGHKIIGMRSIQYPLDKLLSPSVSIQIFVQKSQIQNLPSCQSKYFCKEDCLTYRQPLLYDLAVPIKCSEPYSKIVYWGVLEIPIEGKVIQLLTTSRNFTIRDTVIKDFDLVEKVPLSFPFFKIKATNPVGWIVVDSEKVQVSKGHAIQPHLLELQVWKNGKRIEEREFRILSHGKKWLTPILMEELDKSFELLFILQIKDEAFSDFSSIFKVRLYKLIRYHQGLKLRREFPPPPCDFPIRNEPKSALPRFGLEIESFSQQKFRALNRSERELFRFYGKTIVPSLPREKDILVCLTS